MRWSYFTVWLLVRNRQRYLCQCFCEFLDAFLIDVLYSSLTILNSARVSGVKDAKSDCCKLLPSFIRSSGDIFFQSKMYVSQHSFQSILISYFAFMIVYHTKHTLILASMLVFFFFFYLCGFIFRFDCWLLTRFQKMPDFACSFTATVAIRGWLHYPPEDPFASLRIASSCESSSCV